jgi:hypothetical protein
MSEACQRDACVRSSCHFSFLHIPKHVKPTRRDGATAQSHAPVLHVPNTSTDIHPVFFGCCCCCCCFFFLFFFRRAFHDSSRARLRSRFSLALVYRSRVDQKEKRVCMRQRGHVVRMCLSVHATSLCACTSLCTCYVSRTCSVEWGGKGRRQTGSHTHNRSGVHQIHTNET